MLWLWPWPGTHGIFGVGVAVGSGFSLGAGLSLGAGVAVGVGTYSSGNNINSLFLRGDNTDGLYFNTKGRCFMTVAQVLEHYTFIKAVCAGSSLPARVHRITPMAFFISPI